MKTWTVKTKSESIIEVQADKIAIAELRVLCLYKTPTPSWKANILVAAYSCDEWISVKEKDDA